MIACDVPPVLPNIVNGTLLVLKPGQAYFGLYFIKKHILLCKNFWCKYVSSWSDFREGVNFTYSCETGFWMSDGEIKQTSKNVMCLDGEWVPSPPTAIRCVSEWPFTYFLLFVWLKYFITHRTTFSICVEKICKAFPKTTKDCSQKSRVYAVFMVGSVNVVRVLSLGPPYK